MMKAFQEGQSWLILSIPQYNEPGAPCISLCLKGAQTTHSKLTPHRSRSLAPIPEAGIRVFTQAGITRTRSQKRCSGIVTGCQKTPHPLPEKGLEGLLMEISIPQGRVARKSASCSPELFISQLCSLPRTTK